MGDSSKNFPSDVFKYLELNNWKYHIVIIQKHGGKAKLQFFIVGKNISALT